MKPPCFETLDESDVLEADEVLLVLVALDDALAACRLKIWSSTLDEETD